MRRLRTGWRDVLPVAGIAAVVACASNGGPTAAGAPAVSPEWVTGAAAAALGPDGRFTLPGPRNPGPLEIGEAGARAQAVAWARLLATIPSGGSTDWFAPGGSGLERDYGGTIPLRTSGTAAARSTRSRRTGPFRTASRDPC
jgi:hypothetical protein